MKLMVVWRREGVNMRNLLFFVIIVHMFLIGTALSKEIADQTNGFSITSPEGWSITETPNARDLIKLELSWKEDAGFQVRVYKKYSKGLDRFTVWFLENFNEQMGKRGTLELLSQTISTDNNNDPYAYFEHRYSVNSRVFIIVNYLWVKNNKAYVIQGGTPEHLIEEFQPIIEESIESFKISDSPSSMKSESPVTIEKERVPRPDGNENGQSITEIVLYAVTFSILLIVIPFKRNKKLNHLENHELPIVETKNLFIMGYFLIGVVVAVGTFIYYRGFIPQESNPMDYFIFSPILIPGIIGIFMLYKSEVKIFANRVDYYKFHFLFGKKEWRKSLSSFKGVCFKITRGQSIDSYVILKHGTDDDQDVQLFHNRIVLQHLESYSQEVAKLLKLPYLDPDSRSKEFGDYLKK
jgi:hypothetical protein